MKKPVLFIDFEDSFSLNIESELYRQEVTVERILFNQFIKDLEGDATKFNEFKKIILGPGPGHPDEYLNHLIFKKFFNKFLTDSSHFAVGICLGHQIIGHLLGLKVIESTSKKHGEAVQYQVQQGDPCFPNELKGLALNLQRYNSLTLGNSGSTLDPSIFIGLDHLNEIACLKGSNFLTYQFHPESVGTKYREEIFSYLVKCLYN